MTIGKEGTIEYKNNMSVFEKIISKCVRQCGYNIHCYHSDLINQSGAIDKQVIEGLRNDDIVIADLRRNNVNVAYELGIRHAFGKRSILVCSDKDKHLFFYTMGYRAIPYKIDGASNREYFEKLKDQVDDIVRNPNKRDNPVTDTMEDGINLHINKINDSPNESDGNENDNAKTIVNIKINRILEDAQEWLPKLKEQFLDEATRIMNDASSRGMAHSGSHVVLHIQNVNRFIELIDGYLKTTRREIQDLLLTIGEKNLEVIEEFHEENDKFGQFISAAGGAIEWAKEQNYSICARFTDKPTLDNIIKAKRYIR
jgi:hypothetical protein